MELVSRLQKPEEENIAIDITKNLPTLQFESALTDGEKELQYLRKRAHALTINSCAQAAFLVSVLNETRQLKKRLKSPQKRSTRILQDTGPRDPLKVGILGCGRLGSQLAHCLITYGGISPKDLKISTRRPETLEYLLNHGVDCFHDNIKLVTMSHIVFLCVLPSQIPAICDEIKLSVSPTLFIYSFASSCPVKKLRQLLGSTNVVRPEYIMSEEGDALPWDFSLNVQKALESKDIVRSTCPLTKEKSITWYMKLPNDIGVVTTNEKLAELVIFMFVNMCTHLQLNKYEVLDMLHAVMFNDTEEGRLQLNDFIRKAADKDEFFPPFDLAKVAESKTAVLKKLIQSDGLYKAFTQKYEQIFEDYLQQKAYRELYQTQ